MRRRVVHSIRNALRLAYLIAQHPFHLHRALVRRGLALGWLDEFAVSWDHLRPPGVPITDFASFQALAYHYATQFRERFTNGDHFEDQAGAYSRLFSYLLRGQRHPLRWLLAAWHLRKCKTVLEYGAGTAPYASGMTRACPWRQHITVADQPGLFLDYCRLRFKDELDVRVVPITSETVWAQYDGIVCTEVFEHLPDPVARAKWMRQTAATIVFDYVDEGTPARMQVLRDFDRAGCLSGPDSRGLYVWRRQPQ